MVLKPARAGYRPIDTVHAHYEWGLPSIHVPPGRLGPWTVRIQLGSVSGFSLNSCVKFSCRPTPEGMGPRGKGPGRGGGRE